MNHLNTNDWQTYHAVVHFCDDHCYNPSVPDICEMLGLDPRRHKSAVDYRIKKLERHGLIIREQRKARTIRPVPEAEAERP